MTLESCDWLEWGTLLHVVNTAHMVLILATFLFFSLPRAVAQTQTSSRTHADPCRQTQRNMHPKHARTIKSIVYKTTLPF